MVFCNLHCIYQYCMTLYSCNPCIGQGSTLNSYNYDFYKFICKLSYMVSFTLLSVPAEVMHMDVPMRDNPAYESLGFVCRNQVQTAGQNGNPIV